MRWRYKRPASVIPFSYLSPCDQEGEIILKMESLRVLQPLGDLGQDVGVLDICVVKPGGIDENNVACTTIWVMVPRRSNLWYA